MNPAQDAHREPFRLCSRLFLAFAYALAGVLHVAHAEWFLKIMPNWVPFARPVIIGTGVCEIAGAIGLLTPRFRAAAGSGLALYAVCVYPANIKHAIDSLSAVPVTLGWWYHAPRLALQPVLVWWALFAGGVLDWPFERNWTGFRTV
jgi:uncharacterized membrane protein